jgi:hypothetical protein
VVHALHEGVSGAIDVIDVIDVIDESGRARPAMLSSRNDHGSETTPRQIVGPGCHVGVRDLPWITASAGVCRS